ncbi:tyrosine-type recombinase/integrase [Stieleria varia]|uniref:Site-specific tyrosine recombinase XerC n=1 Tax=Stieleria varia TaxID=2528005 RepID=A0A5C6B9T7_9BACT|nr:tyrosine-type recombinase/integrase [Stieleria varia]TWU08392.1 site-specific tyrosine recombinase XerC [Stieleria varia]
MSRRKRSVPEMKYHVSGQARVFLDGRYFYLGPHGSAEAQARYDTLVSEYLADGRKIQPVVATYQSDCVITVQNVTAEYRREIDAREQQLGRYRHLCTLLEDEYGDLPAVEFGPRRLAELRDLLVATGNARKTINHYITVIVRIFRHAVSRELIDVNVFQRLETLDPLKRGQTTAAEYKERLPADLAIVKATAEFLSPQARMIITLQIATGMRPKEVFSMRPRDIDRSGAEWFYRPQSHKTQAHGVVRAVPIVGAAREALTPFLLRDADSFCFSPAESAQWFRDQRTAKRKTPPRHGNCVGDVRVANPKRQPGTKFNKDSLNRAVRRACEKAKVPRWTPYQLRHLAATAVAEAIGIEGARALLSHRSTRMTEQYVHQQQDEAKAIEAAWVAPSIG